MASAAERVRALRQRRKAMGLREVRFIVPDARSAEVRVRIAQQVARLDPADEADAMDWIERVSEFDTEPPPDAPR